jgi:folate-dependent phosphoribosylglycinamide formyltransferase PurN/GNAT superfamily N-acetyltransferase
LPVNLLAPLGERYGAGALAAAHGMAGMLGYRLTRVDEPDDRLCAWVDWQFAPSWWSSEVRAGSAWYAQTADGAIAGFAAYGSRDRSPHWLQAYRDRPDVGVFGPYGVAAAHRKTGIGVALLTAALCELAKRVPSALIPAVSGDRLIASYVQRADAHVVDSYDYELRAARAVILASGSGTNAQAVIDGVAAGDSALTIAGIVTNHAGAGVRARARDARIAEDAVVWDRAAESRPAFDERVIAAVARYEPDLVLLLGWMHVLPPAFLARFPQTINLHPAFLPFDSAAEHVVMPDGSVIPAFRGARAPEATIAAGVAWAGVTVHRVTPATDRGDVLVRTPFALAPGTTLERFRERVRPLEHAAVAKAIRRWSLNA